MAEVIEAKDPVPTEILVKSPFIKKLSMMKFEPDEQSINQALWGMAGTYTHKAMPEPSKAETGDK